jgi:ABC-2 type transport system permease protein
VDGIAQFTGNATQLGLLVIVLVAASALCLDARPEMAVFLRTRVPSGTALLPAVVLNSGAAVAGLACGTAAAWYETAVLLGPPPAGRMLIGFAFTALFLVFAVALTALAATLARSAPAAAGLSLGVLLALAAAAVLPPLQRWSPTALAGATPTLLHGAPWTDLLPAVLVCVAAVAALLASTARLATAREY